MKKFKGVFFSICLLISFQSFGQETRLLRNPDISESHIVFVYANDLWVANQDGSDVKRLTTYQGMEFEPHFSPDGSMIAFTGQYDGNTDVFVVPATGGTPRRITWHPSPDITKGWTPDGKILFASGRERVPWPLPDQFWSIGLNDKFPERVVLPRIAEGQISEDGKFIAYQKIYPWESEFRIYRGGQTNPIRIFNTSSYEETKVPWEGSNDLNPVWLNGVIYFLSDRDYASNVWSYNPTNSDLKQVTFFKEFDCKSLESGGGKLVFENGGFLHTYTPGDQEPKKISVSVQGDFPWARDHWTKVAGYIQSSDISPTGKRAVFSARGEIFTVPAKEGNVRNITNSPGAADRDPAWSPDGKWISWFSDESGEYQLKITDQYGKLYKTIALPDPTFYYTPEWSPDSKHLAFGDESRNIWIVNIESGKATKVDDEGFAHPVRTIYPEWSPDSKWLAYAKRLPSEYNAIFAYSVDQKKSFQITDGLSNCMAPAWDKNGENLYFLGSTNYGLHVGWLDMSSIRRPQEYGVYVAVLSKETASPLAPKSDEEDEAKEEEDAEEEKSSDVSVKIDFGGLSQRILALDVPVRSYIGLESGEAGKLYILEVDEAQALEGNGGAQVHEYNFSERELAEVASGVSSMDISNDGKKLLIGSSGSWIIADAKPGTDMSGAIATGSMKMKVVPGEEWHQIFREAWRYQRDFFYVENVHGLDLDWAYNSYSKWVEHVKHRDDLNYILDILGGETSVGHSFNGGGIMPDIDRVPVGLLGADLEIKDDRYRITRIYNGENWNPNLRSPLSGPGIDINVGDYVLAVNGVNITADQSFYSYFDQMSGEQIMLTVNSSPSSSGSREVKVVPVSSESGLRQRAWIEDNRRKVDELSGGKLAYVWLPNTGMGGYQNFNRYYFAQKHKDGAILDERYNQGGYAADYIVDLLARDLMGYFNNPIGDKQPFTSPGAGIWGPKVMIINETAGSGGDYMPYMFQKREVGTLVGTKTWGGLVGIWDVPPLIDNGYMTAPRGGFYNTDGEWDVENIGVSPDVEVEDDAKSVIEGGDPQLERAVQIAMDELKENPVKLKPQPADPIRVKRPGNN